LQTSFIANLVAEGNFTTDNTDVTEEEVTANGHQFPLIGFPLGIAGGLGGLLPLVAEATSLTGWVLRSVRFGAIG